MKSTNSSTAKTMDIQDSYDEWSETYDHDRNLTRDLDEKITRECLGHLRCSSILELGCGTAKNTVFLATLGNSVHALDFSEGMIARAKERVRAANVTFSMADITERWPLENSSIDLISCNLVLEHVEDLSMVFGEAFRVLKKGGRFFLSELHPFRQYQGKKATFERNQKVAEIHAFVHHVSDFINAANSNRLSIERMNEWWHEDDAGKLPRLISFMFLKEQ
jgi:ubiquinone/menaquinone biosynthesis C-methylase UbiE